MTKEWNFFSYLQLMARILIPYLYGECGTVCQILLRVIAKSGTLRQICHEYMVILSNRAMSCKYEKKSQIFSDFIFIRFVKAIDLEEHMRKVII